MREVCVGALEIECESLECSRLCCVDRIEVAGEVTDRHQERIPLCAPAVRGQCWLPVGKTNVVEQLVGVLDDVVPLALPASIRNEAIDSAAN